LAFSLPIEIRPALLGAARSWQPGDWMGHTTAHPYLYSQLLFHPATFE